MNGRTAKALRKVFKQEGYEAEFKQFKKDLRHSPAGVRKRSYKMARDIARSGKPINIVREKDYAGNKRGS